MRISVLKYLFRDSLSRAFENAVSTASRIVVSIVLSCIGIGIAVYTDYQQETARKQLIEFGSNRMVVEIPFGGDVSFNDLEHYGDVLELHVIPGVGILDFGDVRPSVLAYDEVQMSKIAEATVSENILLAEAINAGIQIPTTINGRSYNVVATEAKGILRIVRADVVMIPLSQLSLGGMRTGRVVFFESTSTAKLREAEQAVKALIAMEFGTVNVPRVTSSLALQERMEAVERTAMAQKGLALVILSVALALIYGALALQEYRVEEFSAALMRSMGYSPMLLVTQRCIESAVFVSVGLFIVVGGIFLWDASVVIPWDYVAVFLSGGVLLSMIPLFKAADKEIGLVLP